MKEIKKKISENGLRVTGQRVAVLKMLLETSTHPSAEDIILEMKVNHPTISVGAVYKILETFVAKNIITKINSKNNVARYDAIMEQHHHIFIEKDNSIKDYFDEELNGLLAEYFKNKIIENFDISSVQVQIFGNKKKIK